MSLNGQYFSPSHAGEGFYLTEKNGRMIGALFTYTTGGDGAQQWYVFDCQRNGSFLTGRVLQPLGGALGSNVNPSNVTMHDVGEITFIDNEIGLSFEATIHGVEIGYPLVPLFGQVEPEPEGIPGLTLQKDAGGTFIDADIPLTQGPRVIHKGHHTSGELTLDTFHLVADEGKQFSVVSVEAIDDLNNPCAPRVVGIDGGDFITSTGTQFQFRCGPTGGPRSYPVFRVEVSDGTVINLVYRVSTG